MIPLFYTPFPDDAFSLQEARRVFFAAEVPDKIVVPQSPEVQQRKTLAADVNKPIDNTDLAQHIADKNPKSNINITLFAQKLQADSAFKTAMIAKHGLPPNILTVAPTTYSDNTEEIYTDENGKRYDTTQYLYPDDANYEYYNDPSFPATEKSPSVVVDPVPSPESTQVVNTESNQPMEITDEMVGSLNPQLTQKLKENFRKPPLLEFVSRKGIGVNDIKVFQNAIAIPYNKEGSVYGSVLMQLKHHEAGGVYILTPGKGEVTRLSHFYNVSVSQMISLLEKHNTKKGKEKVPTETINFSDKIINSFDDFKKTLQSNQAAWNALLKAGTFSMDEQKIISFVDEETPYRIILDKSSSIKEKSIKTGIKQIEESDKIVDTPKVNAKKAVKVPNADASSNG